MEFSTSLICCSSVHDAREDEMASPACLSSNVGYVEERGVCMLLRKATLACLVLAMRIDLSFA